ncbi:MAG: hypothetical protein ABEJ42_01640 [Halobacteriaceae archaeon]
MTPELGEAERAELARLREEIGSVDLPPREPIGGGFEAVDPMLAETLEGDLDALDESAWIAERKYDGTRLVCEAFGGEVRAYTRRGVDRADDVPAVRDAVADLAADRETGLVLDGELAYLDESGAVRFAPVHTDPETLAADGLAPRLFCFDLLYDGEDLTDRPLLERRERLGDALDPLLASSGAPDAAGTASGADAHPGRVGAAEPPGPPGDEGAGPVVLAPYRTAGFAAFYDAVTEAGEEGIMVKRRDGRYYPGVRSEQWRTVKRFTDRDAVVVGYTEGEGNRADTFGSLVLTDGARCIGRVGTGFTEAELSTIAGAMEPVEEYPVPESAARRPYQPVEPFVVRVRYQTVTPDGRLRAPVFVRRRPEKPPDEVEPIER